MKYRFSPEDDAFRQEVRDFLRDNLEPDLQRKVALGLRLDRPDYMRWFAKLQAKGWATPSWPKEYGGTGWTHLQRYIFDEECQKAGTPRIIASGINMLGPVLMAFGTPEQKAKYLPAIQRSEIWWGQGFSEPGSGSDLASLRTTAVRDGDHYVVNGHKIWTSYAHFCEMLFCLVRTDPQAAKPQEGISFLLVDAKAPGVTIRPIRMLEGGVDLNEVFLDNVRVPVENLVGEENKGWSYGKYLLGHERTGIAGIGSCKQQLIRARELAAAQPLGDGCLLDDPALQTRLAELEAELMALEYTGLRILSKNQIVRVPGVEASILKVVGTELRQRIYDLLVDIAGPQAVPFSELALQTGLDPDSPAEDIYAAVAANALDIRKVSIYGGTNEVQRNVIAKVMLS